MVSWKLAAVAIVLISAMMANVVTKLEASFNVIASHATLGIMHHHEGTLLVAEESPSSIQKEMDILRNGFLLSWIIGGCIPGSCVGIWIRALTNMTEIAKTFGVSLFTSFCASPWIIKTYFSASPETCLLVGFLLAVGAWLLWEVLLILASRTKAAAISRGWIGVKDELLGKEPAAPKPQEGKS